MVIGCIPSRRPYSLPRSSLGSVVLSLTTSVIWFFRLECGNDSSLHHSVNNHRIFISPLRFPLYVGLFSTSSPRLRRCYRLYTVQSANNQATSLFLPPPLPIPFRSRSSSRLSHVKILFDSVYRFSVILVLGTSLLTLLAFSLSNKSIFLTTFMPSMTRVQPGPIYIKSTLERPPNTGLRRCKDI